MNQKNKYKESLNQTLNLFKLGNSMPEIAYKRNLAFSTIENHLRIFLEEKRIELSELLNEDKINAIKKATDNCDSLKEIKKKLLDEISYGEIRYVLTVQGKLKQKKKTVIDKIINTYMGNYCFRKCFNHLDVITDCSQKFDILRKSMKTIDISFKEFNSMMKNGKIKICKLNYDERICYVSWKYFEYLNNKNTDFWNLKR